MFVRQRQIQKLHEVRGAYTLMEMLVVVAIIVVLAGIGGYYLLPQLDTAKENIDYMTTQRLAETCETYKLQKGEYPASLDDLARPQANGKPLIDESTLEPKVGAQYRFNYDASGSHNQGLKVDIWVDGPNGLIANWLPPNKK